ncbi:hypothetical protein [Burkholderia sp. BE17]|uniref:hypothetical protein n=1 Tax=Burkholderia sp. BE17 TaxID=2656644 RepID=UPI001D0F5405|nr:hypothetical protein [Burkholderia sp. BE17]
MLGHIEDVVIFLAEHDKFLAVLANEESVDGRFVSAVFEPCRTGSGNDRAGRQQRSSFHVWSSILFFVQVDVFGPGPVSGKSRVMSKQDYSIFRVP